ncbi:hypothetical protein HII36_14075 [Nonomuraea sp. NN258]|nr:hypothetical protein [Nonomuraea antri]NRQ32960.1 hypothetical protein [Nonomuraea antri]
MTQLIAEMKRLEGSWSDVDVQIHNALRSIGTTISGPGLLKDIGFQVAREVPRLQQRLDLIINTQKIGLDKGVVWADETLWASNSPAGGAAAAKSVADQLRKARKDATEAGGPMVLSRETLDLLERHQHDPYFAVALMKEIPPKELKALLGDLHGSVRNPMVKDGAGPQSSDLDRLLKTLSVTLGTASRGVGDMRLPKGYTDELIATDGSVAAVDGRIVDKLLQYGTFDDAFLRDIANKVFDNAQKPASERADVIAFSSGLATALARNPRVAQDFFTDPVRKPLAFLMRETHWSDRGAALGRAIEAATRTYRDHGQPPGTSRGYKSALIASWAGHFWSDPKAQAALADSRQSAARIFSTYMSDVHRVANGTTSEKPGVHPLPDTDPNLPGNQPHGARFDRENLMKAMTWAAKDPKAFSAIVEGHGEYSLKLLDARAAAVAKEVNGEFTAWLRRHPEATKAEQSAYREKILKDSMAGSPGDFFKAQVFSLSKSLYFVTDAGNMASINDADRKDERNKAFSEGLARTTKLALTPFGNAPAAIFEFAEGFVSDKIKFNEGDKARDQGESKLLQSQNLFKDVTANIMMRYGLFGKEAASDGTHPHAFGNSAKGSEGDFLEGGLIKPRSQMTETEVAAYEEWLKHSKASGIFASVSQNVEQGFQRPVPKYEEAKD